jgi:hypothetical protein
MAVTAKKVFQVIPLDVEQVGKSVLDAAFKVHTAVLVFSLTSTYHT